MRLVRAVLLAPVVAALWAVPAQAATYCVQDPACPAGGIDTPTVDSGAAAMFADAGDDVLRVGPGGFTATQPVRVRPGDTVTGGGAATTTLTGRVELLGTTSALRDLTLRLAPGADRGVVAAGPVTGVAVVGGPDAAAGAIGYAGGRTGSFDGGSITMATGTGAFGDGVGSTTVSDSTIDAPVGVASSYYGIDVLRTRITATTGVVSRDGDVTLDAVLIDLRGADATGVLVGPGETSPFPSRIRHTTVRGTGAARQTGIAALAGCYSERVFLTVDTTVLAGVTTSLRRFASCPATPAEAAHADLAVTRSAFDPATVVSVGPGDVSIDPVVSDGTDLDANGVPVPGSELIDAGDPAEAAGTDIRGWGRPYDGDGDGAAVADVGAFEVQPDPAAPGGGGTTTPPTGTTTADVPDTGAGAVAPAAGGVLGAGQSRVAPTALRVRAQRYRASRPGRYAVRSRLAFPAGTDPSGGVATLRAFIGKRRLGALRTTVDRRGHADFKLRIRPRDRKRVRVQVRFGGTDSLTAISSARVTLP